MKPKVMWLIVVALIATTVSTSKAQTFSQSVLHSFVGYDGIQPDASLAQGIDGNYYGTAFSGGSNSYGTIFRVTPAGAFTLLYTFCSVVDPHGYCTDGANPNANLIQGSDGNFYGTTVNGGANDGGSIFKITPAGSLTTLYNFCGLFDCHDGERPYGDLVQVATGTIMELRPRVVQL